MSDKLTDLRNIRFLLHEVLNVEELLSHPYGEGHSKETFEMAIDTAYPLARGVMWPALKSTAEVWAEWKAFK